MKKGYDKVRKAIDQTKNEIGLIITEKEKFDEMIEEYLDKFEEAPKLKAALDDQFSLIQTRSEAILAYTSHFITLAKLQSEVSQKKAQVDWRF